MTIDTHGRQHRPAGSPASTGGQYAAEQAPGQAQPLGLSPEQNRELVRAAALDAARRLVETERLEETRTQILERWPDAAYLHWGLTPSRDGISRVAIVDEEGEMIAGGAEVANHVGVDTIDPGLAAECSEPIRSEDGWMPHSLDVRVKRESRADVATIAALLDEQQLDEMAEAIEQRRLALRYGHLDLDELRAKLAD